MTEPQTTEVSAPAEVIDPYTLGVLDGIFLFAWMRDGTYYVGTTGTTLRAARRRVLDERGYRDTPDPFYPDAASRERTEVAERTESSESTAQAE
jgi:hypothetical protein